MYRDGFTFSIMRALMEILYESHIPFIIMTATIPVSLEKSLFEEVPLSDKQKLIGNVFMDCKLKISIEDNPLYSNGRVNISEELLSKVKKHKTLIIVNQVKRAQEVYEEVKSRLELNDNQIVLLHSRFTKTERKSHEDKALSLIPHKNEGKIIIPQDVGIVVSTQVLEAGIDFSAELLLTEIAPADSLIQRAGRCSRYEKEKGEMFIFTVEEENKGYLPYGEEYLLKTLEWLRKNKDFNIKNFDDACRFVNETIDYQANDYEARDTLIDLYECVLYADTEPSNIQLRKSKPSTLVVMEIPEGSGERVRKMIEETIKQKRDILRENSINVDTGVVWHLFRMDGRPIEWEIEWRFNPKEKKNEVSIINLFKNKKKPEDEDPRIAPFRTYILNSKYYDKHKGIYPDVSYII